MKNELLDIYRKWEKELTALGFDSELYSHPYYISLPDDWENAHTRIMIVGEEGHGKQRLKNDIEYIQKAHRDWQSKLIDCGSPFWIRFKKISDFGCCIWNNLDKVHRLREDSCRLSCKERKLLHSTKIKILAKEIELLKPNVVVFFGWYGDSIKEELPSIYEQLYPNGAKSNIAWSKKKYFVAELYGISFIFTYHPAWRQKPSDYEATVLEIIKNHTKKLD